MQSLTDELLFQLQKYEELVAACRECDAGKIEQLLNEGVSPSHPFWEDKHNTSCLDALVLATHKPEEERIELIKRLCEKGANIYVRNSMGTLLVRAICCGSYQLADFLIESGIDVNAVSHLNSTALHHVYTIKDAEFLLLRGANLFVRDTSGRLPRDRGLNEEVREYLLKKENELKQMQIPKEWIHEAPKLEECQAQGSFRKALKPKYFGINSFLSLWRQYLGYKQGKKSDKKMVDVKVNAIKHTYN